MRYEWLGTALFMLGIAVRRDLVVSID